MNEERSFLNITFTRIFNFCVINKTLNSHFHYLEKRPEARSGYRITQNIIARDRLERHVDAPSTFDPHSSLARTKSTTPIIRENLPLSLPRRSFRTYPFSPLLTSDYRLPRASFRTCATHADTSALKVIAVITEG